MYKLQEGASFTRPRRSEILDNATTDPLFKLSEDVPKTEDVTTFRIRFAESMRVVFNPLLLQAAFYFKEDVKNIVSLRFLRLFFLFNPTLLDP